MNYILSHAPVENLKHQTISSLHTPFYDPRYNVNDADDSPDDAFRVIDRPVIYSEDCIAAGCPEGLW